LDGQKHQVDAKVEERSQIVWVERYRCLELDLCFGQSVLKSA
jgi:hypothetical protein